MATDVLVTLDRLRCIHESDGTGHSEPYIWPVLIWIDTATGSVHVTDVSLGNARIVIDNDMRAGQTVIIPAPVNTLRLRINDTQRITLILSVVLWENDETPEKALEAGFRAYSSELQKAVEANLLTLRAAQGDPDAEKAVRDVIEKRVKDKVESSIKDALSTSQKLRIGLGTLNMDDVVGSDSESLGAVGQTASTKAFSLAFSNKSGSESYEILGNLDIKPVPVDLCQTQVNAVRAAQRAIDDINNRIHSLQEELQTASPLAKPQLIALIQQERQELAPATVVLQKAKQALQACRDHPTNQPVTPHLPSGGVFTT